MVFNKEKQFQGYFTKLVKEHGYWVYKIPDVGMGYKPFDCIVASSKQIYPIELKILPTRKTNLFKKMRPHQIGNLYKINKLGHNAFVLVHYKKSEEFALFDIIDLINPIIISQEIKDIINTL